MSIIYQVISKYVNQTVLLIIICICLGWLSYDYTKKCFVTQTTLAAMRENLYSKITKGDASQRLDNLYLQRSINEKMIWDIEERLEKATDRSVKNKWLQRLKKLEKECDTINKDIKQQQMIINR